MLSQANHWMEIVATAADVLLLCRVLMLRLHRVYVFITLACLLSIFFDAVDLSLGTGSEAGLRVFLYSRFLYAVLYPLIAWDVFEEMKTQIAKLRRLAIGRLISGLVFATMFGFILALYFQDSDAAGQPPVMIMLAIVLWAGSSTATLAFLWTLHRAIRAQHLERPNNTHVWMIFYQLLLIAEVLTCFFFSCRCWRSNRQQTLSA